MFKAKHQPKLPSGSMKACRYPQTSPKLAGQPIKTDDVDEEGGA